MARYVQKSYTYDILFIPSSDVFNFQHNVTELMITDRLMLGHFHYSFPTKANVITYKRFWNIFVLYLHKMLKKKKLEKQLLRVNKRNNKNFSTVYCSEQYQ